MSLRSRFDLWYEHAVARATRRALDMPIIGRAARRVVRWDRLDRISTKAAAPAGISSHRSRPVRTPTGVRSAPIRRASAPNAPVRQQQAQRQARVIHVQLPQGQAPGTAQGVPASGMSAEQVARHITTFLAARQGSGIEIDSLSRYLAARGIPAQVTQTALRGAHSQGWVKKSGKGRVAATAKSVRAGGVPTTTPRRRAG